MPRYGTIGDYRFSDTQEAASDIRGAKIYGRGDEKLGEIDDVVFDEATGAIVYVVVDTGGWLTSKKFIVPPQEVRPSLQHDDDFLVESYRAVTQRNVDVASGGAATAALVVRSEREQEITFEGSRVHANRGFPVI